MPTLPPPLTKSLVDLFASLGNAPSAVSTEAFTSALKWGPVSRQQDVHEFWTLLCERLETEVARGAKRYEQCVTFARTYHAPSPRR